MIQVIQTLAWATENAKEIVNYPPNLLPRGHIPVYAFGGTLWAQPHGPWCAAGPYYLIPFGLVDEATGGSLAAETGVAPM